MKRTTDISGFQDILDGAVAIDPDAAAREIGVIRDLIAGSGLEGQLDAQLHHARMRRIGTAPLSPSAAAPAPPTARGDLIPGPADEAVSLENEAAENALFAKVAVAPPAPNDANARNKG